MNINILYNGKDYNFDLPNDTSIDYIKELSSKITKLNKESFDLIYNNEIIKNNNKITLIKNIIPEGEKNVILTIDINRKKNNYLNDKTRIISIKNNLGKEKDNNLFKNKILNLLKKENKILNKLNQNKSNKSHIFNNNENPNLNKIIKKDNDSEIFENFQSIFIKKNNILFSLMKEFNKKIKEIYLCVINKYIQSLKNNEIKFPLDKKDSSNFSGYDHKNNYIYDLILFEKKIIKFQECQIKKYSRLLKFFQKNENNEILLKLNELYNILVINNTDNTDNINKENYLEIIKPLTLRKIASHKLINSKTSTTQSLSSIQLINNKLPILKNKNSYSSLISEKNITTKLNDYNMDNSIDNSFNIRKYSLLKANSKQTIDEDKIKLKYEGDSNIKEELLDNNILNDMNNTISEYLFNKEKNKYKNKKNKENNLNYKKEISNEKKLEKVTNDNNKIEDINKMTSTNKKNDEFNKRNSFSNICNNNEENKKIDKKHSRFNSLDNSNDIISFGGNKPFIIAEKNSDENKNININEKNNKNLAKKESPSPQINIEKNDINTTFVNNNHPSLIKYRLINSKKKKKKSLSRFDFMI